MSKEIERERKQPSGFSLHHQKKKGEKTIIKISRTAKNYACSSNNKQPPTSSDPSLPPRLSLSQRPLLHDDRRPRADTPSPATSPDLLPPAPILRRPPHSSEPAPWRQRAVLQRSSRPLRRCSLPSRRCRAASLARRRLTPMSSSRSSRNQLSHLRVPPPPYPVIDRVDVYPSMELSFWLTRRRCCSSYQTDRGMDDDACDSPDCRCAGRGKALCGYHAQGKSEDPRLSPLDVSLYLYTYIHIYIPPFHHDIQHQHGS